MRAKSLLLLFNILCAHAFINSISPKRSESVLKCRMSSNIGVEIERTLLEKYGASEVSRVVDSWNRVRNGDAFEKNWEGKGMQQAVSYIEGLFADPWHDSTDTDLYPWVIKLESGSNIIAAELKDVMEKMDKMSMSDDVWAVAAREEALAYGPDWRTLVLQDREWDPINIELFPKTTEIIKTCGIPSCEAFFAKQAPHTGIKPHTDDTNFILTAHLGLDIPEGECSMRVGEETREWKNNKVLIFDTSFVHSTKNDSDRSRTVLLLRFFHPQITRIEREALEFIFKAVEDPSVLSSSSALVSDTFTPEIQKSVENVVPPTEGMSRQERRKVERANKKAAERKQ